MKINTNSERETMQFIFKLQSIKNNDSYTIYGIKRSAEDFCNEIKKQGISFNQLVDSLKRIWTETSVYITKPVFNWVCYRIESVDFTIQKQGYKVHIFRDMKTGTPCIRIAK